MEEALSLYLDLQDGRKADLEVLARASLAWAAAIRGMAAGMDPMSEVRIDVVDGTEGSFSLNAVVRFVRSAIPSRTATKALVMAVLLWMSEKGVEWTYEQVLDAVKDHVLSRGEQVPDDQTRQMAREAHSALKSSGAEQPRKQFYREIERDDAIEAVGATDKPGARPATLVPRSEFARRAGDRDVSNDPDETKRTVTSELDVILISPVLKDAERSWRFQHGALPEFGATMKDHDFLDALRAGRIGVPLKPGIRMRIELKSREEMVGGVWEVQDRSVTRVLSPTDGSQPSFLLPTEK
jgi:hypothetical protein